MGKQIARAKNGKKKQKTYAKYMLQYNTFVAQMELLYEAIIARREQLAKLDELVKSRKVEQFNRSVKAVA